MGDSPIRGAGLFADDRRGVAAATGVGEDNMRTALSFRIVEMTGRGIDALTVCETAMGDACDQMCAADLAVGEIAVVAIDPRGGYGYAANHDIFCYVVAAENVQCALHKAAAVHDGKKLRTVSHLLIR